MFIIQLISIVAFLFGVSYISGLHILQLVDVNSLIAILLVTIPTIFASGHQRNIFLAGKILRDKDRKYTLEELKNAGDSLKLLMIIPLVCSFCITIIGVVGIICNFEDKTALASALLLSFIPLFYSALFLIIILPLYSRIIILQNKAFGLEY
jgi:flagellar motor component MotA